MEDEKLRKQRDDAPQGTLRKSW